MKKRKYLKGKHYKDLGTYLGTRLTYTQSKTTVKEHIFATGKRDLTGVAILKRVFISETNKGGLVLNLA